MFDVATWRYEQLEALGHLVDVSPVRAAGLVRAIVAGEDGRLPVLGKTLDDEVSLSAVRLLDECLYGLLGRCDEHIAEVLACSRGRSLERPRDYTASVLMREPALLRPTILVARMLADLLEFDARPIARTLDEGIDGLLHYPMRGSQGRVLAYCKVVGFMVEGRLSQLDGGEGVDKGRAGDHVPFGGRADRWIGLVNDCNEYARVADVLMGCVDARRVADFDAGRSESVVEFDQEEGSGCLIRLAGVRLKRKGIGLLDPWEEGMLFAVTSRAHARWAVAQLANKLSERHHPQNREYFRTEWSNLMTFGAHGSVDGDVVRLSQETAEQFGISVGDTVALVGMGDRIEAWRPEALEATGSSFDFDSDKLVLGEP